MKYLLLSLFLFISIISSSQGWNYSGDTLRYVSTPGDTIKVNKVSNANNVLSSFSAGTAYTITATSAKITFGTTSPSITFLQSGVYEIKYVINSNLVGATFASNRTITYKVRRTNNSATDLTNSSTIITLDITTTKTYSAPSIIRVFYYTATRGDIIELWGAVSVVPTAGSFQITDAGIMAKIAYW